MVNRGAERLEFIKKDNHYWLQATYTSGFGNALAIMTLNADASPLMRWHERLGHLNVSTLKHMIDHKIVHGMDLPKELFKKKFTCLSCMSAKRKRISYKVSAADNRTKVNYERIMSDVCDMGKRLPVVICDFK